MQIPKIHDCQRWREKRESYRPTGEPIDTRRYDVDLIDERLAKAFVLTHHYSGTYPAARFRVGLYEVTPFHAARLCGVAVFSVGQNQKSGPKHTGARPDQCVELGRFVLNDFVPANGETFFLARAFRHLTAALPEIQYVLSYSDPVIRHTANGLIRMAGHVGTIYQAHSGGRYLGRASPRTMILDFRGHEISLRALSKLRNSEQGAGYAYERLLASGAPRRHLGESDRDYVERALREGPFRRVRHPGNHLYVFPIGAPSARRRLLSKLPESLPYPKIPDEPIAA